MKKIFALSCLIFCAVPLCHGLTLEECRHLAEENYPLIDRYELIKQTSDYTLSNLSRNYLPQLQLSGQASYQTDVAKLPDALTGIMESYGYDYKGLKKDQYRISLDLNQVIWDGGETRKQKNLAAVSSELQAVQTDVEMYSVRGRVNDLFFGILLIDENIRLNSEHQNVLLSACNKLEAGVTNGVAMKSDVDAVRAEYLRSIQQRDELDAIREGYVKVLSLFTGLAEADVCDLKKPEMTLPLSMTNNRPEMRLFNARLRQTNADEDLIDAGLMPKLSLFAQAVYGYPSFNMFDDMLDRSLKLDAVAGIRLTWNIGRFYTRNNDKRKISLLRDNIEVDRNVFAFNTDVSTSQQKSDIEKYRKLLSQDDEIIALRQSVRKAAESKLENGVIDSDNLLQEISRENQAKISKVSHEIELIKKIYELKNTINQ